MSARRGSIDPRFARFQLCVGRSRIDKFGVFAAELIPAGKRVIQYVGQRITQREAVRRQVKRFLSGGSSRTYVVQLNRRWCIDGSVGGGGAELINHSCSPNLTVRKMHGKVFLYSAKKIAIGKELSYDYGYSCVFPCRCGSKKCRRTMCHF